MTIEQTRAVADWIGNGLAYGLICVGFMCPVWVCFVMARVIFS